MLLRKILIVSWSLGLGFGCVEQQEDKPTEQDMAYVKQHLLTAAPSPRLVVNADLDGKVTYLGMDADPAHAEPGKEIKITHYWKVNTPPGEGWRTFVHVSGPNNQGFMNFDHHPIRGKYPVSQWKAGDIIRDEHVIRLPPTWPHQVAEIYTGIWKGQTRLAVKTGPQDGANRLRAAVLEVKGQAPAPVEKKYTVRKVKKAPKLDGKLDDAIWNETPSTGVFVNTMSGEAVRQRSEAKMAWDDKFLYLAFDNQDDDVWGEFGKRDDKLWQQEAVEIMIDANGDGRTYVELQVSPKGTVFDTYLPEYRKYEDTVDAKAKPFSWNSGLKAAVQVDGSLNKRDDADKGWTAEIAIPLADVNGQAKGADAVNVPPAVGATWRLNLFRLDVNKSNGQEAQAWSAPMVGDFHKLDRFGTIVFGDEKGEVTTAAAAPTQAVTPEAQQPADSVANKKAELRAKRVGAALEGMPKTKTKAGEDMKLSPNQP